MRGLISILADQVIKETRAIIGVQGHDCGYGGMTTDYSPKRKTYTQSVNVYTFDKRYYAFNLSSKRKRYQVEVTPIRWSL